MNVAPYFGVIDIGNSGIKASMAETSSRNLSGAVRSVHYLMGEEQNKPHPKEFDRIGSTWTSIDNLDSISQMIEELRSQFLNSNPGILWKISSVQPHALATLERALAKNFPIDTCHIISHLDIPLTCSLEQPENVGIDRLLAAWSAWHSSDKKNPLIVIQAGTAVTVDWLDENGEYCGGAIMPGLSLTLKYLALGTVYLPWLAPPRDPRNIILPGRNTKEAILAGVTAGFVGGIELLQRRYRQQYAGDPSTIETVVSGGDGLALSQAISPPFTIIDHLVLKALARLP